MIMEAEHGAPRSRVTLASRLRAGWRSAGTGPGRSQRETESEIPELGDHACEVAGSGSPERYPKPPQLANSGGRRPLPSLSLGEFGSS